MFFTRGIPSKMFQRLFHIQMILSLLLLHLLTSETARILSIMPHPSKSHHNFQVQVLNGLLSRGHQITFFNPFDGSSKSTENLTNIIIDESEISYVDSVTVDDKTLTGIYNLWLKRHDHEFVICNTVLSNPKMKEIIKMKKIPYDLIMFESYNLLCFLPLAEKHQLPVVNVLPINDLNMDYLVGRPNFPSVMPLANSDFSHKMNFLQRLQNTIGIVAYHVTQFFVSESVCNQLINEYYGPNLKPVNQMYSRIKLVLYGTHPTLVSTPIPPNVVEIGGVHITDEKPLPADIQKFIDESEKGVIYFSLGSAVRCSSIPIEKLNVLVAAFAKIPQRILFRCDQPNIINFPNNMMVKKWIPQRDVLAHKNVRAFISHTGIFSTLEAIHTGTPIIAIPIVFDQRMNARIAAEIGIGLHLDFDTLTKNDFVKAMEDIINDKRYYNKMQEVSSAFRDRPMSPLETAIYWIEYVIRHNGASHLTPISALLPLYKYLLLDVLLFIIVTFAFQSYILYFFTLKIFSYFLNPKTKNEIKKNK